MTQLSLENEASRRRTFAIISHPDAGKTTLTEKILRLGGAIQMAGQVRAKGERRRTRSDWLDIERQRGISVASSVMTFEYQGCVFNLLDTPGHEDFSEDTYRTLTAVDAVIMVIDGAKGIELQTKKLFEISRLRDIPIITFINKMDRESREPLELLDEIASTLALDTAPITWPIGRGRQFCGVYDLPARQLNLVDDASGDDPRIKEMEEEVELVRSALPEFDKKDFLDGALTPIFFGSAIKDIGVGDLLEALAKWAPSPRTHIAGDREVLAHEDMMTALVFKIQANMDPKHRDRMAFVRICSGCLKKGMRIYNTRTGKSFAVHAPQFFFARNRQIAQEAYPGDIVGIPNHGTLRIGDTLTEGEDIRFTGVPHFAPEILRRIILKDAMKAKKLNQALKQLAEEGVVQIFRPVTGTAFIIGVVGQLQLDVLSSRLASEYNVSAEFEPVPFSVVRWLSGDKQLLETFQATHRHGCAQDFDGDVVFLASSDFAVHRAQEQNPDIGFHAIKQIGSSS